MSFSPIFESFYLQAVTATASGIGVGNIPSATAYAEGTVRLNSVVVLREGTTPTATKGEVWNIEETIYLRSRAEMDMFQAVEESSTDATIGWTFYSEIPGVSA